MSEEKVVIVDSIVVAKPEGKGLAVTGFILATLGLILSTWITGLTVAMIILGGSAALFYSWLVLCILSIVLSVMGMVKLKRTGGKRGLGIAGMIIGIVATVYMFILWAGMSLAVSMASGVSSDLEDLRIDMEQLNNQ